MVKVPSESLRLATGPTFTRIFRSVIYEAKLPYGARILALTMLDTPLKSTPSNSQLARKLKTNPSQISVWRSQLKDLDFIIRANPREFHLSTLPN